MLAHEVMLHVVILKSWRCFSAAYQILPGFIRDELLDESNADEKVKVEVAYVVDGAAHIDLLDKAFELMDEKTPTLAKDEKVKKIEKGRTPGRRRRSDGEEWMGCCL
ncbi:hypothetical protein QBC32DRAFT_364228 [Pseudoneurospora amorphoporcata]|uniref:Uncharacterized protein n=1 Tax=Pseudoneurospora amorphoporcata TaxID=241081 RepID=A0AAN6SDC3_9PEZI|nr:hypothetical protein QBC32DRAFT_364228 [Pseudoneurospora amorphoporcata]